MHSPPGRKALSLSSKSRKAILFRPFVCLVGFFLLMHNHTLLHGAKAIFQIYSFSQSGDLNFQKYRYNFR